MATSSFDFARLQFPCPKCGRKLKADPAKAGKKARCKGCGHAVVVPGLSEPPPRPPLDMDDLPTGRQPLDELDLEVEDDVAAAGDASAGPASLYLGAISLVLFLAAVMAVPFFLQLADVGPALVGVLALGGLALSWKGWRLAGEAKALAAATGQGAGYAMAGRWSHGLIAVNYLSLIVVAGLMFWMHKAAPGAAGGLPGGLGGLGDLLKPLMEQKKEADKLIDEINRR